MLNKIIRKNMLAFVIGCYFCAQMAWGKVSSFVPLSFSADVEQVITTTIRKKEYKTLGKIDYQYPGNFRYEQIDPETDKIIFVANNKVKKSWYYRAPFKKGESGDLMLNPMQGKFPLSRLFDALTRGLNDNDLYGVKKKKEGFLLSFSKAFSSSMGFKEALLVFADGKTLRFEDLQSVKITKLDKSNVVFNMLKIRKDLKFGNDQFVFVAPPNTNISQ